MKEVEEVLAITALKKLVEKKHLVKKDIRLGERALQEGHIITLYLTENGLRVFSTDVGKYYIDIVNSSLMRFYSLTYHNLNTLLQGLNERS